MSYRSGTAYAEETGVILPDALYPLNAFYRVSGVSRARIHEAKREGVELSKKWAGKRAFVHGRDGIEFILKLDAMQSAREAQ
jgi:hypothetical protein